MTAQLAVEESSKEAVYSGEAIFYPSRFVGWSLRHFTLIVLLPLALLLVADVAILLRGYDFGYDVVGDLTDAIFLSALGGGIVAVALARRPLRSAVGKIAELEANGTIRPKPGKRDGAPTFSQALRDDIGSNWRWMVTGMVFTLGLGFSVYAYYDRSLAAIADPERPATVLWVLARWLVAPLLITFVGGGFLWMYICLGRMIHRIPRFYALQVGASHPDRSGGLRRLGEICLDMAMPLLVLAAILGAWVAYSVFVARDPTDTVGVFGLIGLAMLLMVAVAVFFAPLWTIHQAMAKAKTQFQDRIGREIQEKERQIATQDGGRSAAELELLLKEHEALRKLGETARRFPVWPFDTTILVALFSAHIASLSGFIVNLALKGN